MEIEKLEKISVGVIVVKLFAHIIQEVGQDKDINARG